MSGILEVITGSMFSGKSEELIRRVKRAKLAKREVIVFKHSIDKRYSNEDVVSHNKSSHKAFPVSTVEEMEQILSNYTYVEIIAIDEAQFFGNDIVSFIDKLVDKNKRVIVAGLDLDFKGEPFFPMPILMAKADKIDKLKAICTISGEPAWCSQRLINGKPAYYDDPLVVVGAKESYEARSRRYHIVRHRNKNIKEINIVITISSDINYENIKNKLGVELNIINSDDKLELIKEIERRYLDENDSFQDYILISDKILDSTYKNIALLKIISQYSKYLKITIVYSKNEHKNNILKEALKAYKIDKINSVYIKK